MLASAAGTGNASATGVASEITRGDRQLGTSGAWSSPLGNASREAITRSVRALIAALPVQAWSARVADVRDDEQLEAREVRSAGLDREVLGGQPVELLAALEAILALGQRGAALIARFLVGVFVARLCVGVGRRPNRVAQLSGATVPLFALGVTGRRDVLRGLDLLAERFELRQRLVAQAGTVAVLLVEGFA